jgi:hypothetical protein
VEGLDLCVDFLHKKVKDLEQTIEAGITPALSENLKKSAEIEELKFHISIAYEHIVKMEENLVSVLAVGDVNSAFILSFNRYRTILPHIQELCTLMRDAYAMETATFGSMTPEASSVVMNHLVAIETVISHSNLLIHKVPNIRN